MGTAKNDLAAAKPEDTPVDEQPAELDADLATAAEQPASVDEDLQAEQDAEEAEAEGNVQPGPVTVVRETDHGTYTYKGGQGNTDPADFGSFGSDGNYVEKRDR